MFVQLLLLLVVTIVNLPNNTTGTSCYECDNCPEDIKISEDKCTSCNTKFINKTMIKRCSLSSNPNESNNVDSVCSQYLCNSDIQIRKSPTKFSCYECDNCSKNMKTSEAKCDGCSTMTKKGRIIKKCQSARKFKFGVVSKVKFCFKNLCNSEESIQISSNTTSFSCYECDDCPKNIKKSEAKCKSCSTTNDPSGKSSNIKKECHMDNKTNEKNGKDLVKYCYKDLCNSEESIQIPSNPTSFSCYECDDCPKNIKKSEAKCKSCSTTNDPSGKSSNIKKECHMDNKTNKKNGNELVKYCYEDLCNSGGKILILKSGLVGIVVIAIATIL